MRLRPVHAIAGLLLSVTETSEARREAPSTDVSRVASQLAARRAQLPLRFEANAGQWGARVRFVARASGASLFLTDDGATLAFRGGQAVTMRVVGRTGRAPPVPSDRLGARSSYFIGNDPSRWHTDVPSFRRVTVANVLPGVHEVFHGEEGALEYDFVVAPGAKPESIELAFDGAESVALDAKGNLALRLGPGEVIEPAPRVYQRTDGRELAIAATYRVTGVRTVAFDIGAYDTAKDLVIDPVLAYATYLGGNGSDYGYGVAVDANGAMYVTGYTTSADFPTAGAYDATLRGADDVFVTKLDASGTELVYSTYLGGSDGAYGYGIAVDSGGAAYVVGSTNSPDFPTTGAFQATFGGIDDAFVAKLSPSGSLLEYATFLGGAQRDYGYGIAVDAAGAAYVVGSTYSDDFPVASAAQRTFGGGTDAFVAKLAPSGATLAYSTYLGGSQVDEGRGIAVDSAGAAYVAGYSASIDFPTAPGTPFQSLNEAESDSAFVAKLSPSGSSFVYSTYLGGSVADQASAIAVDTAGAAYVTGFATSPDFPSTAHAFQTASFAKAGSSEAFVTKFDPTGTALAYSTFLGGSGGDMSQGIGVDGRGEAYVTGFTASTDFPIANTIQSDNAAAASIGTNAFAAGLSADGSALLYSTYLGGSVSDSAQAVAVAALDGGVAAYVTGYTASPDFPTRDAVQGQLASNAGDNAFVAVIAAEPLVGDAGPVIRGNDAAVDSGVVVGFGDAAEPTVDASVSAPPSVEGGGCSCGTGEAARGTPAPALALAMAGVVAAALRRRGRHLRTR